MATKVQSVYMYGGVALLVVVLASLTYFAPSVWSMKSVFTGAVGELFAPGQTVPKGPPVHMYDYVEVVDGCDHAFVGDCVNLPPEKAKQLYVWAVVGTPITVQD